MLALPVKIQAQTQNVISYVTMNGNVQKTLIREIQYPASISYVETAAGHYFVYYDGVSNSVRAVSFFSTYSVNDFVIGGDTVFFCGSTATGVGFVGHFNRNDLFFSGTPEYQVTNWPFYATTIVTTFNKMGTYQIGNERRLALIGRTQQGLYVSAGMRYDPVNLVCNYQIGELGASYNESLLGITVTDNYVVTAGFMSSGTTGDISLRIYQKSNMFAQGGPQNDVYYYYPTGTPDVSTFDATQIVISNPMNDYIAVAAYWKGVLSPDNLGVAIWESQIQNNAFGPYLALYEDQSYLSGPWTLRGMTGFDAAFHFYLLHNAYFTVTGDVASEILMMDFNPFNPPQTDNRAKSEMLFQGIDARSGSAGYVSNGSWQLYPDKLLYNYGNVMPKNCMVEYKKTIATLTFSNQHPSQPFVTNGGILTDFLPYIGVPTQLSVTEVCTE